jgi:LytS/YehU family sensor histidine kinase
MQLNPHFLFNAMNTIAMLVRRQENSAAVRMVAGLSDLLRSVLEEAPPQEVPLRRELKFIERYLELERTRFADRLRQDIRIDADTLDALVPNLILQPLVENAVKHGVALRPAGGTVTITARRAGDRVVLAVEDDGAGVREAYPNAVTPATGIPVSRSGIGLANIQARLDELYGDGARLDLQSRPDGFVATVTLPYRTSSSASVAAA